MYNNNIIHETKQMTKPLDFDVVKQCFTEKGYKLFLEKEDYKGVKTRASYECPKGHQGVMTINGFRDGKRCQACSGNLLKSIDDVRVRFEREGYTLLESEYVNAFHKMKFLCDNGHQHAMSWDNFNHGKRCIYCSKNRSPILFDDVKRQFKDRGFTLQSTEYSPGVKLKYTCSSGHSGSIIWASFRKGHGCHKCANMLRLVCLKTVEDSLKTDGYELLTNEYTHSRQKLPVLCEKGHEIDITWNGFKNGNRCSECAVYGFKLHKPATLYYLRFDIAGHSYWKIGITNLVVERRFRGEPFPFTIIQEKIYLFGYMAKEEEKRILEKYDLFKYTGKPLLRSGNTELFTKDILRLDFKRVSTKSGHDNRC